MEAQDFIGKYKNKILNVAIIILSLFIASKIYKEQLKGIDSLKEKKNLESKRSEILESISRTEKKNNAYKELLSRKDASNVISTVSNIAKEFNIKIISIRPTQQQKYIEYAKIPFDLVLNASSFHDLGNFISKIESHRDVYTIDSLGISIERQSKQLNINLTLSSIVYK